MKILYCDIVAKAIMDKERTEKNNYKVEEK